MPFYQNDREVWLVSSRDQWLARRQRNIGASEVAALFHAHQFTTAYQLWCLHTGRLKREDEDSDAMRRGRIFEPAVGEALREMHPEWIIQPARQYIELRSLRLGATPDFYAWQSRESFEAGDRPFLIQAKVVTEDVFEADWTPTPPAGYLLQVQAEMMIAGAARNILAVMVLDGRKFPVHEYPFVADVEIHAQIAEAARRFWHCVERQVEPTLHHPQDAWAIAKLYPDTVPDVLALHGKLSITQACEAYITLGKQIKALEAERETLASKLKGELRNHAYADAQDYRISWPVVPGHVRPQVEVKAHRRFSVTKRKTS